MDIASILLIVEKAINIATAVAPVAFQAIENIKSFATQFAASLKGDTITPDEQAQIETMVDALYAKLQEPLPPAQPGDPDYKG